MGFFERDIIRYKTPHGKRERIVEPHYDIFPKIKYTKRWNGIETIVEGYTWKKVGIFRLALHKFRTSYAVNVSNLDLSHIVFSGLQESRDKEKIIKVSGDPDRLTDANGYIKRTINEQ